MEYDQAQGDPGRREERLGQDRPPGGWPVLVVLPSQSPGSRGQRGRQAGRQEERQEGGSIGKEGRKEGEADRHGIVAACLPRSDGCFHILASLSSLPRAFRGKELPGVHVPFDCLFVWLLAGTKRTTSVGETSESQSAVIVPSSFHVTHERTPPSLLRSAWLGPPFPSTGFPPHTRGLSRMSTARDGDQAKQRRGTCFQAPVSKAAECTT